MKRVAVRLAAVAALVVVGSIAIAQVHRQRNAQPEPTPAVREDAGVPEGAPGAIGGQPQDDLFDRGRYAADDHSDHGHGDHSSHDHSDHDHAAHDHAHDDDGYSDHDYNDNSDYRGTPVAANPPAPDPFSAARGMPEMQPTPAGMNSAPAGRYAEDYAGGSATEANDQLAANPGGRYDALPPAGDYRNERSLPSNESDALYNAYPPSGSSDADAQDYRNPSESRYGDTSQSGGSMPSSNPPGAFPRGAMEDSVPVNQPRPPRPWSSPGDAGEEVSNSGYQDQPNNRFASQPSNGYGGVQHAGLTTGAAQDRSAIRAMEETRGGQTSSAATAGMGQGTGVPGSTELEGIQTPSLAVEKFAPAEIQVNKPALFEVRVRNTGSVPAHHVEVRDIVPRGTVLLATRPSVSPDPDGNLRWQLGTLQPGDEQVVRMEVRPMAEGEIGSVATVHMAAQASVSTVATRPQLELKVTMPEVVMLNEQVTMVVRISNPGTGVASGVVLTEQVPAELHHPYGDELQYEVGELKPGEARELELTLEARKAGTFQNRIVAVGEANLQSEVQTPVQIVAPELKLSIDGPTRRFLDRPATYEIMVSNPGTAAAREIEIATHVPKGMEFVEANNYGQYDSATRAVYWSLETLPPGQNAKVMLVTKPVELGSQRLTVESSAQMGLNDKVEHGVSVEGVAALRFEIADVEDPIEIGSTTTYKIRVLNEGSKAASNVSVLAAMPQGMIAEGAAGAQYQINTQKTEVYFEPIPRLAPGAEVEYTVRAQATQAGTLRFQVKLFTDDIRDPVTNQVTPVTKEESTRVYADQ